jgi:hypothetical protein
MYELEQETLKKKNRCEKHATITRRHCHLNHSYNNVKQKAYTAKKRSDRFSSRNIVFVGHYTMEKRRRVDQDLGDDDDCVDSEEEKELRKVVDSFVASSVTGETDAEKREKLEKKLKERQVVARPVESALDDVAKVEGEDFDDELSYLFSENVALEDQHDFRKTDALFAKSLPYLG